MLLLQFKCPDCGRALRGLEAPRAATVVHDRTCRGCGKRWRLVVRQIASIEEGKLRGTRMHEAEFNPLPPRTP